MNGMFGSVVGLIVAAAATGCCCDAASSSQGPLRSHTPYPHPHTRTHTKLTTRKRNRHIDRSDRSGSMDRSWQAIKSKRPNVELNHHLSITSAPCCPPIHQPLSPPLLSPPCLLTFWASCWPRPSPRPPPPRPGSTRGTVCVDVGIYRVG
jgi:hypothetical protein